jgi:hypothetical protein
MRRCPEKPIAVKVEHVQRGPVLKIPALAIKSMLLELFEFCVVPHRGEEREVVGHLLERG